MLLLSSKTLWLPPRLEKELFIPPEKPFLQEQALPALPPPLLHQEEIRLA